MLERIARVFKLLGGNVGSADLAPNFVLAVRLIARHHLFEVFDRIGKSFLRARDAAQLVMRVDLIVVNLNSTLESFPRRFQLATLLMNQPEIVMR